MKRQSVYRFATTMIFFSLVFSACGATQDNQADQADPTSPPLPADIPSDVPIDLVGPEVGSSMVWVDNSILVYVPGGDFKMGASGNDNPEHDVALSDFWIYRTEVTNRMYALCVANGKCTSPLDKQAAADLNKLTLRENPVVGVAWQQAADYCTWISGRLPTEAEWELTARGPQSLIFPWGDSAPTCDQTNFIECTGSSMRVYDHPLGRSYYDALDMSGNVYEWVGDYYRTKYYLESPTQDPPGPDTGTNRVVRGGSFETDTVELPTAKRSNLDPLKTRPDLGFRCVVQEPVLYPSFCQASAFVADIDPINVPPSGGSCEINAKTKAQDCGSVTADINGGTITDVSAGIFSCTQASSTRVYCSGPASSADSVTICGTCTASNSDAPQLAEGISTCGGAFAALANSVGNTSQCNFQGGASQNGCPSGMTENSDGTCSQQNGANRCPAGMYRDRNRNCTSVHQQENICLAGYTYDAQAGCCVGTTYPGCGQNEVETPYGCLQIQSSSESTNNDCVTLTLDTGQCNSGGNGVPGCSLSCGLGEILNAAACKCENDPNW